MNIIPAMRDWAKAHEPGPVPPPDTDKPVPIRPAKRGPVVYTPATEIERRALGALAGCRYSVGSFHKRFARQMERAGKLTEGQRRLVWLMVWRYRRQIRSQDLIEHAKARNQ